MNREKLQEAIDELEALKVMGEMSGNLNLPESFGEGIEKIVVIIPLLKQVLSVQGMPEKRESNHDESGYDCGCKNFEEMDYTPCEIYNEGRNDIIDEVRLFALRERQEVTVEEIAEVLEGCDRAGIIIYTKVAKAIVERLKGKGEK